MLSVGLWATDEIKSVKNEPKKTMKIGVEGITDSLKIEILKAGNEVVAEKGDFIEVHYKGWLESGKEFDNSFKRGQPLKFGLGQGKVIKGWDVGLVGASEGERRLLKVPAKMAYGEKDLGIIPPNSTLWFEVVVLKVNKALVKDRFVQIEDSLWISSEKGLMRHVQKVGEGALSVSGDKISVHYTGWLLNGNTFGSSKTQPKIAEFTLGGGKVIKGWEKGLEGVQAGETLWLKVPPSLGYGPTPLPRIPAHSTLIFRVEVLGVEKGKKQGDFPEVDKMAWTSGVNGLEYVVEKEGAGAGIKVGEEANVHYTGWLLNGTKFDSSIPRGAPFTFKVGARQVIPGWDLGVEGMKVGEVKWLRIPASLGYGARSTGPIPANSILLFKVERMD